MPFPHKQNCFRFHLSSDGSPSFFIPHFSTFFPFLHTRVSPGHNPAALYLCRYWCKTSYIHLGITKSIDGKQRVVYNSRRRRTAERTEAAAVVEYTQAPPATIRLHRLQDQIPTQERFMASWKGKDNFSTLYWTNVSSFFITLPQNVQVYLACWVISIFFTILRREAPYRVPYLPTIPTFLVRLAYLRWENSETLHSWHILIRETFVDIQIHITPRLLIQHYNISWFSNSDLESAQNSQFFAKSQHTIHTIYTNLECQRLTL